MNNLEQLREKVKSSSNNLFAIMYRLVNVERNFKFTKFIINSIEQDLALNQKLFENSNKSIEFRKNKYEELYNKFNTNNHDVFELLKYEFQSPFGLISKIFEYDIPDIIITNNVIKFQYNSNDFDDIIVPAEARNAFKFFLDHFINNQKFINGIKMDRGEKNSIQDTNFANFRLNIIHNSLSSMDSYVIAVRKHIDNMTRNLDIEKYEESLGVSQEVLKIIKKNSGSSFCIFGSTGSGKTTLLRYLTNYKFEEKRNVCIIEDNVELFLNAPLSFVTNENYNIHDLFVSSLRQNPSHIIIGETRNDEIIDILETGLTTNVSTTIHADSIQKAMERIYFMANSGKRNINKKDIMDLTSASMNMFIHMKNKQIKGVWIRNDILDTNRPIIDLYDDVEKIINGKRDVN